MNQVLLGAIATTCFIIGLILVRSWRSTRDRFFLFFAASFIIEGASRIVLALHTGASEQSPSFYLIRLFVFALIIYAIIDKNRAAGRRPTDEQEIQPPANDS